jgi:hypothetical protein
MIDRPPRGQPKMTEAKSKCRWFRFSLRALFVVMTAVGVGSGWVAYQLNWIREQHDFLNRHPQIYIDPPPGATCPWPLKLFREDAWPELLVPVSAEQAAKRLFPESRIRIRDDQPRFSFPLA